MPDQSPAHEALRGRFAEVFRCLKMKIGTSWDLKWMGTRLFLSAFVRIHLGFVTPQPPPPSRPSTESNTHSWLRPACSARSGHPSWSFSCVAWGQSGKTCTWHISSGVLKLYHRYGRCPERPLPLQNGNPWRLALHTWVVVFSRYLMVSVGWQHVNLSSKDWDSFNFIHRHVDSF